MTVNSEPDLPPAARAALAIYRERFNSIAAQGPLTVAWGPGRVNLIGEHTDYNEGWVLPVAVDRAVAIAGRRLNAPETQCVSAHHRGYVRFPVPVDGIEADQPGRTRGLHSGDDSSAQCWQNIRCWWEKNLCQASPARSSVMCRSAAA